ncbi:hypothetical protein PoB_003741000 [Plakobranchus ocellatus]|uniref:Uncharacterized protein n=1 Tax=Plakobranchus ocellatus TaxID=259542 RepID=A0AAV4AVJ5_9GAST|nr:hypothetical protein PoB_003741000 [Plakobranchus ocellatus]
MRSPGQARPTQSTKFKVTSNFLALVKPSARDSSLNPATERTGLRAAGHYAIASRSHGLLTITPDLLSLIGFKLHEWRRNTVSSHPEGTIANPYAAKPRLKPEEH